MRDSYLIACHSKTNFSLLNVMFSSFHHIPLYMINDKKLILLKILILENKLNINIQSTSSIDLH